MIKKDCLFTKHRTQLLLLLLFMIVLLLSFGASSAQVSTRRRGVLAVAPLKPISLDVVDVVNVSGSSNAIQKGTPGMFRTMWQLLPRNSFANGTKLFGGETEVAYNAVKQGTVGFFVDAEHHSLREENDTTVVGLPFAATGLGIVYNIPIGEGTMLLTVAELGWLLRGDYDKVPHSNISTLQLRISTTEGQIVNVAGDSLQLFLVADGYYLRTVYDKGVGIRAAPYDEQFFDIVSKNPRTRWFASPDDCLHELTITTNAIGIGVYIDAIRHKLPVAKVMVPHPLYTAQNLQVPVFPHLEEDTTSVTVLPSLKTTVTSNVDPVYPFDVPITMFISREYWCIAGNVGAESSLSWTNQFAALLQLPVRNWNMAPIPPFQLNWFISRAMQQTCHEQVIFVESLGSSAVQSLVTSLSHTFFVETDRLFLSTLTNSNGAKGSFAADSQSMAGSSTGAVQLVENKAVFIAYKGGGSGNGLQSLTAGKVPIVGTDSVFSANEFKQYPLVRFIPFTSFAISVAYNIPGLRKLIIPKCTLVEIFKGTIDRWSHPDIARHNPNALLPSTLIHVFVRSGRSGTTEIFTHGLHLLDSICSGGKPTIAATKTWPTTPNDHLHEAETSDDITEGIKNTIYSIGYAATSSVLGKGLHEVTFINTTTNRLVPRTTEQVSSALQLATLNQDTLVMNFERGDEGYPFTGVSYLAFPRSSSGNCTEMKGALEFAKWMISDEPADAIREQYFTPLPAETRELSRQRLLTAKCDGGFVLAQDPVLAVTDDSDRQVVLIFSLVLGIVGLVVLILAAVLLRNMFKKPSGLQFAPLNQGEPFAIVLIAADIPRASLLKVAKSSRCFLCSDRLNNANVFVASSLANGFAVLKALQAEVFEASSGATKQDSERTPSKMFLAAINYGHGKITPPISRSDEPHYFGRVVDTAMEMLELTSLLPDTRAAIITSADVAAVLSEGDSETSSRSSAESKLRLDTLDLSASSGFGPEFKNLGDRKIRGGLILRFASVSIGAVQHPPSLEQIRSLFLCGDDDNISIFSDDTQTSEASVDFLTEDVQVRSKLTSRRGSALHIDCTVTATATELFRYHQIFTNIIDHYGGEVESLSSVCAVATFGVHKVNVLHEHNACRAALKLQEHLHTTICITCGKMTSYATADGDLRYAAGEAMCSLFVMATNCTPQSNTTRIFAQQEVVHSTSLCAVPHDILVVADSQTGEELVRLNVMELFEREIFPFTVGDLATFKAAFEKLRSGEFEAGCAKLRPLEHHSAYTNRLQKLLEHLFETRGSVSRAGYSKRVPGLVFVPRLMPLAPRSPTDGSPVGRSNTQSVNDITVHSIASMDTSAAGSLKNSENRASGHRRDFALPTFDGGSTRTKSLSNEDISSRASILQSANDLRQHRSVVPTGDAPIPRALMEQQGPTETPPSISISEKPQLTTSETNRDGLFRGSDSNMSFSLGHAERSRLTRKEVATNLAAQAPAMTSVDDGLFAVLVAEDTSNTLNDVCSPSATDSTELPTELRDVLGVEWKRSRHPLSSGTFAVVYRAVNDLGRVVSVKCFDMESTKVSVSTEDIANEVSALSSYGHENIIGYITYGFMGRYCFILMEHAAGGSLNQVLRDFGTLTIGATKNYFREALRGLEYLHSHNVIHCDVKPHNILIGSDGICKIADFGSTVDSAFSSSMITERTVIARGTPGYMAPEACRGSEAAAGDIYGIGISMIELLTGELPWGKMGNLNHFIARLGKDTTLEPKIPTEFGLEVEELLVAMLQREPDDRPTASQALQFPFFL